METQDNVVRDQNNYGYKSINFMRQLLHVNNFAHEVSSVNYEQFKGKC